MRKHKTEMIPHEVLVETTCDLCGTVAKRGNWKSSKYEVAESEIEVTVRQKDGELFQEIGDGTTYVVDMCPICFKKKLIPWLASQGCKAKVKEWAW